MSSETQSPERDLRCLRKCGAECLVGKSTGLIGPQRSLLLLAVRATGGEMAGSAHNIRAEGPSYTHGVLRTLLRT
jgi:hypothetical protein